MRAGLGPKRSARGKTKHLVLPRPFHWQVGGASNAHSVLQPAIDYGLDEIGASKASEIVMLIFRALRFSRFAMLSAFGSCYCKSMG